MHNICPIIAIIVKVLLWNIWKSYWCKYVKWPMYDVALRNWNVRIEYTLVLNDLLFEYSSFTSSIMNRSSYISVYSDTIEPRLSMLPLRKLSRRPRTEPRGFTRDPLLLSKSSPKPSSLITDPNPLIALSPSHYSNFCYTLVKVSCWSLGSSSFIIATVIYPSSCW